MGDPRPAAPPEAPTENHCAEPLGLENPTTEKTPHAPLLRGPGSWNRPPRWTCRGSAAAASTHPPGRVLGGVRPRAAHNPDVPRIVILSRLLELRLLWFSLSGAGATAEARGEISKAIAHIQTALTFERDNPALLEHLAF